MKKLGGGGQAKVYECTFEGHEGVFATKMREMKIHHRQFNTLDKAYKESSEEFEIAKNLQHANIVSYKYLVEQKVENVGELHIIMELIHGRNLTEYLKEQGRMTDI